MLPQKYYEVLKWVALIFMPALSTTIFTLGQIWGWENVALVVGTIGAINTLLGVCVGVSTAQYNGSDIKYDGTIDPVFASKQTSDKALNIYRDQEALAKKEVLLKVAPSDTPA